MQDRTVKVGDVVMWSQVPSGALVRECRDGQFAHIGVRLGDKGWWVGGCSADGLDSVGSWNAFGAVFSGSADPDAGWPWSFEVVESAVILALGLMGRETGDRLWQLAHEGTCAGTAQDQTGAEGA